MASTVGRRLLFGALGRRELRDLHACPLIALAYQAEVSRSDPLANSADAARMARMAFYNRYNSLVRATAFGREPVCVGDGPARPDRQDARRTDSLRGSIGQIIDGRLYVTKSQFSL